ncbi:MAG TPA: type II toxin-antitoxin system HicB family antitoxin [Trueperaceae bacterium]|nr:type II toxin-antitoxin system HicB family antitoxin [Trueperaceae bacterium]
MKTSDRYSIQVLADEQDGGFVAVSPEFPGVSAFGDTRDEALEEVRTALELAIETYEEEGWPLPEPAAFLAQELPSGEFRVRLPRSVHAQLGRRAAAERVSQNQLVVTYVVAGLAGRLWDEAAEGQQMNPDAHDGLYSQRR